MTVSIMSLMPLLGAGSFFKSDMAIKGPARWGLILLSTLYHYPREYTRLGLMTVIYLCYLENLPHAWLSRKSMDCPAIP